MMLTTNLESRVETVVPACVILHKGAKALCVPDPSQAVEEGARIACQTGEASINTSIHFWFSLTTLSGSISSLLLLRKKSEPWVWPINPKLAVTALTC